MRQIFISKWALTATTLFLAFLCSNKIQAQVVYVNEAAIGASNGTSWANAYTSFDAAMTAAVAGDTIWVAKGSYQPATGNSFTMKTGVSIYGGFAGTETKLSQRNWLTNTCILHGTGNRVISNSSTTSVTLDGFTITAGSSNDGGGMFNLSASPTLANLIFSNNTATNGGGGMYNSTGSNPTLTNVGFSQNTCTGTGGGGLYNTASNPVLTDVIFYDNTTSARGGGMYNNGSSPVLTNVVFTENSATGTGAGGGVFNNNTSNPTFINATFSNNTAPVAGAMDNNNSSAPIITNSIFWGNTANTGNADIINTISGDITVYGSETITYSSTQTTFSGTGNTVGITNPFTDDELPAGADGIFGTPDDGLELKPCSPAINAANTAANTTAYDIAGDPRLYNGAVDMGAYEYFGNPDGTSLAESKETATQTVHLGTNGLIPTGSCQIIGELAPDGTNPVSGVVSSEVWIDSTVQTYNGQPYVQRHFDITPATNASTATATITLYATQAEFDAFNAVSTVKLPMYPTDRADESNISIIQFHGISASGTPGTYSGSTVTITPNAAFISWNYTLNRWEIMFPVNGFSGFIITATGGTVLSLNLLSFSGELANGKTQLQWQTADEVSTDHFEVEKSTDGKHFAPIATIKADGFGNNSYSTIDPQPQVGTNYYQLKVVNDDGTVSYSEIITVEVGIDGKAPFIIYPNPTSNQLVVEYDNATTATINIYSLDGQKVLTTSTDQSKTPIDVSRLITGTYIVEYNDGAEVLRDKFVKIN